MHLLDTLNAAEEMDVVLRRALEELCRYFAYGVGFVYEADYRGEFHLVQAYQVYKNAIPQRIERQAFLDGEGEQILIEQRFVHFCNNTPKGRFEERLAALLDAKSIVMMPIFDDQDQPIALVGILDRRGESRQIKKDLAFTRSVLTTLGTYVKMRLYQNRIQATKKSLESILDHMGVDVYVNDFETHEILYLNESMAKPYGGVDKMMGRICWQALYADKTGECDFCPKPKLLDENGEPTKIYGWDYRRPFDGSWFRVLSAAFPWVDGRMAQVVSSIDISENKMNEEIIRRAAEYDILTALPNRARLSTDMDHRIEELANKGEEGYVIFFDLDGFKEINDTLGHAVGDEMLARIGAFLQESALTRDRSYRYGGDEFVVLWNTQCPGTIDEVIAYLRQGFSSVWQLESHQVRCDASIGISHYPSDGTLSSNLVRNADQAMYASKALGSGAVHFYNNGEPLLVEAYLPGEKKNRK